MVKALEPGDPQQVGKYRLLGGLGGGGMGRVFLGRSPGGRLVAVKLIRAELAGDPDFRVRFAREVATARTVSGIFTAPVVDADLDGPRPWLVTAYVEGPSLAEAVASRGPLPLESVLPLAAGLAEGLGVIHAAGVVHRDLKPSNVLLASDGPRIIDFGISRAADATVLTRAGWVSGSPGFMSPEQAEGDEAGPASDIFSLGAVLTFAATGEEPFGTGPATALLYRVVHSPAATGRLPAQLRPLLENCLAKDPRQRPTTDQILAQLGSAPAPPERGKTEPARAPGRRPAPPPEGLPTATSARLSPSHDAATRPEQSPGVTLQPPGRKRSGRVWAAGALAAVLAVVTVVFIAHRPPAARSTLPQRSAPPAVVSWMSYRDPSGFSLKFPVGWKVHSRSGTETKFTGVPAGFFVVIAWTIHPKADQLADWRQQAKVKAASDPTYQQISIRRVAYRGYDAADWEFTNSYQGALTHVIDRGFIVQPGHLAYAIELYGPDAQWRPIFSRMWNELLRSFKPAG